jgi:hypothetical protein
MIKIISCLGILASIIGSFLVAVYLFKIGIPVLVLALQ